MGEHTIREVLKRRSDDTQRVIRRRRDRALNKANVRRRSYGPLLIIVVIVLAIIAAIVYSGWWAAQISERFSAERAASALSSSGPNLNLQATTQFLPNTLLAVTDPNFYSNSDLTISPVTERLVSMYFPQASPLAVKIMVLTLQYRYSRTDILEAFINDVPVGINNNQSIRGFAAASQAYFKKPFAYLQPQDIALLVALAADQKNIDPRNDREQALNLRNAVLEKYVQQTVLSRTQVDLLKKTPLDIAP